MILGVQKIESSSEGHILDGGVGHASCARCIAAKKKIMLQLTS